MILRAQQQGEQSLNSSPSHCSDPAMSMIKHPQAQQAPAQSVNNEAENLALVMSAMASLPEQAMRRQQGTHRAK
jgi:hypothetical protein